MPPPAAVTARPAASTIVERNVSDLRRHRVDVSPCQLEAEVPRQQQPLAGPGPQLRLVLHHPVVFALAPRDLDCCRHPRDCELQSVDERHRRVATSHTLIRPEKCGAERNSVSIHRNDRIALRCHCHSTDAAPRFRRFLLQRPQGRASVSPEVFDVALGVPRHR